MRAQIVHGDSPACQVLADFFFQVEASVIGSQGDFHAVILIKQAAFRTQHFALSISPPEGFDPVRPIPRGHGEG
jgi:hypothetical protein